MLWTVTTSCVHDNGLVLMWVLVVLLDFIKEDFTAVSQAFPTLQSSHVQVPTGEGDFHHWILFRQHGGALWSWLEIFKKIHLKSHLVPTSRKHQTFHFIKFQIPPLKTNPPEVIQPALGRHLLQQILPETIVTATRLEAIPEMPACPADTPGRPGKPLRHLNGSNVGHYMDLSGLVRGLYWFQNFT